MQRIVPLSQARDTVRPTILGWPWAVSQSAASGGVRYSLLCGRPRLRGVTSASRSSAGVEDDDHRDKHEDDQRDEASDLR